MISDLDEHSRKPFPFVRFFAVSFCCGNFFLLTCFRSILYCCFLTSLTIYLDLLIQLANQNILRRCVRVAIRNCFFFCSAFLCFLPPNLTVSPRASQKVINQLCQPHMHNRRKNIISESINAERWEAFDKSSIITPLVHLLCLNFQYHASNASTNAQIVTLHAVSAGRG